MTSGVEARIKKNGPKRILALDGGGIRGMITVEVLSRIEEILGTKSDKTHFVLSDYFDFVAGTSTGAIIAACISVGMTVDEIRTFYLESGKEMFDKSSWLKRYRYKYEDDRLAAKLQSVLGDRLGDDETFGSPAIRTLLMMVIRNASTDSPWPLSNNPFAKYNDRSRDDCNLNIPLWQLVRASTAAPVYFPPEVVKVGPNKDKEFIFVDGGVTCYNNPAFQAFLMATVEPYKLNWTAEEDKMLVVSVGTGSSPDANENLQPSEMNLIYNASSLPSALMFAAMNEQDFLCRVFGDCRAGEELDREIGDLIPASGPTKKKLFTYMRYSPELSVEGLERLGLGGIKPENVQKLDSVDHIEDLQRVGLAVAEQKVHASHFEGFDSIRKTITQ